MDDATNSDEEVEDYLQIAETAINAARGGDTGALKAAAQEFGRSLIAMRYWSERKRGKILRTMIPAWEQLILAPAPSAAASRSSSELPTAAAPPDDDDFGEYLINAAYCTDRADTLRLVLDRGGALAPLKPATTVAERFVNAARRGAVACMEELVRRGADPRMGALKGGNTPLIAASEGGARGAVAWLCSRSAAVDGCGDPRAFYQTPLIAACSCSQPACVEELLLRGADPTLLDDEGCCALYYAATAVSKKITPDQAACISLLLDFGASAAELLAPGKAGLYDICCAGGREEGGPQRAQFLLLRIVAAAATARAGAGEAALRERDSQGRTLLHHASKAGCARVVRALCACGADAGARVEPPLNAPRTRWCQSDNPRRQTPLHILLTSLDVPERELAGGKLESLAGDFEACADELIERAAGGSGGGGGGRAEAPLLLATDGRGQTALVAGLRKFESDPLLLAAIRPAAALLLARWPLSAAFPPQECSEFFEQDTLLLLLAALEQAGKRLTVLTEWRQAEQQEELTAAFLRHVRDACGAALAPAYAPFARFRFVEGGGLERASALERDVHRFPAERVALCRAALDVARRADAAAEELCVPLLREAVAAAAGLPSAAASREAEKLCYAAARAAGRWGTIRAAAKQAEAALSGAEAALVAAIEEAEEQQERLRRAAPRSAASAAAPGEQLG